MAILSSLQAAPRILSVIINAQLDPRKLYSYLKVSKQRKTNQAYFNLGSSAARRPSPKRLKNSTVRKMAMPGKMVMWSATPM